MTFQCNQIIEGGAQDANGFALAGVSVAFAVTTGGGTLSVTNTITDPNGRTQSTLTLGPNLGTSTVQVSADGIEVPATFYVIADSESPLITADVNGDGVVNILDLVSVASAFGNAEANPVADVKRRLFLSPQCGRLFPNAEDADTEVKWAGAI